MLTPNRQIVLLPQDRQIMQLTGMSEKDYRFFMRQAILHSKLRPGEPTAFIDPVSILIQLVIGIALTYLATLLAPKPKTPQQQNLEQNTVQGQDLVNGARYTPKSGFDSVQNVVELGSTIPLVYTNRQSIDGVSYGGVRVNTNLLWSQIYSIGGGQLLRGLFLVGEASIAELDATQFAIGNNLLTGYDLAQREAGRITLYYSADGGRLTSTDYIAGQNPANDVGNAETAGGGDVFQVRGTGNNWTTDFCFASTPSNQTAFGLYGFIGNNFAHRTNPSFRPARIAESNSDGDLNCTDDWQQLAERSKQNAKFSGRTGLIGNDSLQSFSVGDILTLTIYNSTDALRTFSSGNDGQTSCGDVAQTISSRQRSNDEQISYGDLYRIGSVLAICTSRTAGVFVSDADNTPVGSGTAVTATFEVVREGQAYTYSAGTIQADGGFNATQRSHVLQTAEATFSTERQGQIVEVGFRSQLQINIQGLCNFKDARGYSRIDYDACDKDDGKDIDDASLTNFISGQYSTFETRYSFFRISYRVAGTNATYTEISQLFGIRSTTGVAVYNYLRFEFPDKRRWEIRITPVSGWEVRNSIQTGDLEVLDPHLNNLRSVTSNDVVVRYTGEQVARSESTFAIQSLTSDLRTIVTLDASTLVGGKGYAGGTYNVDLTGSGFGREARATVTVTVPLINGTPDPLGGSVTAVVLTDGGAGYANGQTLNAASGQIPTATGATITQQFSIQVGTTAQIDLGNGFDDGAFYGDAWARLAESFIYNEITTTAQQPEHQVVYINTISENTSIPNYDNMAIVGMNIRSSKEISSLSQFSVYVNEGVNSTSNFPEVLYDLLTNERYGTGQVLSPIQIDKASFDYATEWAYKHRYFFDGAVSNRINIRTWAAETASNFLLDLLVRNGKFALQPVATFDGPETITALFTAGNIIEDSFQMTFADDQDRIPPRISVIWREERETSTTDGKGLFPVSREVTVRELGTPETAPLEKIDISDYATSERHAIDRAKWECLTRRFITHTVTFKTTPTEAALDLGSVFKLGIETISYNQPQNGAISATGEVISWPPLGNGVYEVLLWDGITNTIQETTLTVAGRAASPRGAVFCVKNSISDTQTYKVQSLSFDEEGNIDVVATYFPTNESGQSLLVQAFNDTNFEIEGLLGS